MIPKFETYPVWVRLLRFALRSWFFLYDIVAFIPKQIFSNPDDKLERSNRIKAKPIVEGDRSSPWRSNECPGGELATELFPGCSTLDKVWRRSITLYGPNKCLGTREILGVEQEEQPNGKLFDKYELGSYKWLTYDVVASRANNVGSGLLTVGHKTGHNLVIFSDTRVEWLITALGCFTYTIPVTTVYATLGDEMLTHAIVESESATIVTAAELVPKLVKLLPQLPSVKRLIYFPPLVPKTDDPVGTEMPDGVRLLSLSEMEQLGEEKLVEPERSPEPNDTAVIMYTSGTTGAPKGVVISHANLVAANAGQCRAIDQLNEADVYVAYLPLAHVLELSAEFGCLTYGVGVGYSSPLTLMDISSKVKRGCKGDLRVLKPTVMAVVPAICDRLYKGIVDKINNSPSWLQALFHLMVQRKRDKLESGYSSPFLNRLAFKKSRKILGGRVRLMLCGGAPLSAETQRIMNICFCCPVMQGYGLTETCGAGTVADVNDLSTGRVGAPLVCNDFLLRNWTEGGYATTNVPNPQGEILISGGNVVAGYYKNAGQSASDFVEIDGRRWLCTGDIGEFCGDGVLKIIDRKKDLLKLSHGEYVSLAKVETALLTCPLVDLICAYGSSLHSYMVALVVPNRKNLLELAKSLNLDTTDFQQLCENEGLKKAVLAQLEKYGKQRRLVKFEIPTKIHLCNEIWSSPMGLLTEALKLKRRPIEQFYRSVLDRMYGNE